MLSPKEEYKFLKDINNINDIAYFTIFEKYLIQNLKGQKKLIEIESTDQESIIIKQNGGYPIPGMIYTFIYGLPDQIIINEKSAKDFIDLAPVTFCMNNGRGFFSGINMNMLPLNVRLDFFESFYNTFKDFFKKVEELTQNNKLAINKRFVEFIKSGGGQEMIKLFNKKNNANFNYGYRKYDITKVKNLRMIEYDEWNYINFYTPINAFRKINLNEMHKLYNRSK